MSETDIAASSTTRATSSTEVNREESVNNKPEGTSSTAEEKVTDETSYYTSVPDAAPATQVEVLNGLFYTVQVGVYSKPVTSRVLYDISPLNSELTNSGRVKYTSGIFDNLGLAQDWKNYVVQKGISDAFVTAYHNGRRITFAEASKVIEAQGEEVFLDLNSLSDLERDREGQAVWEMVSTSELFGEEVEEHIIFKIRMGPYFDRIPDRDVKVILDFEDNVEYGRREDGAIVYTTKGGMNYNEAQKWRKTFLESGITNANIIALQSGEEIPVKQALDFLLK